MNLQKALEYLGFSPEDYQIEGEDFIMAPKSEIRPVVPEELDENNEPVMEEVDITPTKPSEEQLLAAEQELEMKGQDIVILINEYLKDKERDPENDSLNIVDGRIHSWNFTRVLQPSIAELLAVKEAAMQKISQEEINREAEEYLKSTDWHILRELDSGVLCSAEIKQLRQEARNRIVR